MPTKRRLVIHLGDHKTGSTAIQQVLVSGRVQAPGGMVFPTGRAGLSHHNNLARALRRRKTDEAEIKAQFAKVAAAIDASDAQTAILSGEGFERVAAPRMAEALAQYLPDLAEAMVGLAGKRAELPKFTDVSFAGFTVTGRELADAVGQILGRKLRIRQFPWWSLTFAAPFWPLARWLPQVRYMWSKPHSLDGSALQTLLPDLRATPLEDALRQALPERVLRTPDAEPIAA